jgi:protein-S-isoprenylcysteine O-methyltransferase Ste14
MVIVLGEVRALVLMVGIGLLLKRMGKEEVVLRTSFAAEYYAYERRVRRLVPGIWLAVEGRHDSRLRLEKSLCEDSGC